MVTDKNRIKANRCHIIIGGGSAGILLCQQLLEHGDDVILIERGSTDPLSSAAAARIPSQWPAAAISLGEATRHCTLPQTKLGMRQIMYPQGSGIGGTSNINAMIWSAGHPAVFDRYWPEMWNSKAIDSLFRTAISVIKPDVTYSPLLEHLLVNSKHYQQANMNTQQFGRSNSPQAQNQHDRSMTDNSELIWDIDPVKSIYLTTIDYSSNERISMKDVLRRYQEDIEEVADINRASDIPQIKKDKKNQKIESCRGKLTIFECSTVLSIEFDNCRSIDKAFDQSPPLFDKDTKLAKRRSGVVTAEKMMKAKLVAVGVRYVQRPHMGRSASDSSKKISLETEVKTIAPKGGGEIILCAGAFESPRILISSGLGVQNSPHKPAELNVKSVAEITDDYSSHASQQTAAKEKTIETIDESQSPSPVPFPSLCAFPPLLPVTLMGIGRNLQDHTVLPIMCVGNWWTVCKNSNKASIRETIIKNIERIQDSNTAEWNYCKNDDTDLVTETGSMCSNISSRECAAHGGSIMSRMSSKVISGALTIIIVGTLGILTVVSLYFYSLYLLHGDGDSKWLYVSSFVDFRKYSLLHNLIDQSVSVQANELILWQKSWVYITLLIFSAMLSLCLLNKTRMKENRKCSAGSSSNRKEEGEGEDATIHGSRASIYPLNCVHGYVNLDEMGNVLQRNSLTPPRCLRK